MEDANPSDPSSARAMGLGGAVLDESLLDELLQKVVVLALHVLGSADSVSITLPVPNGFRTSNTSGEVALRLDEAQYAGDDGPCLRAVRTARQVQVDIGVDGERWPQFDEKAREFGVVAVLSTPLATSTGNALGALNVYTRRADGFAEAEQRTAEVVGEHAAILLGSTRALIGATQLNEQLRQALTSREIIGEAKGIIMERQKCSRDEAFDILRRASQRENRKLRDLAEELVARIEDRRREGPAGP